MKNFIKKTRRVLIASLVFVCILALGSPVFADVGLQIKTPLTQAGQNIIYGNASSGAVGNLMKLQASTLDKFVVDLSGNVTAAGKINNLTLTSNAIGFSVAGGTTAKTLNLTGNLTVTGDTTLSGTPLSNPMTAQGQMVWGSTDANPSAPGAIAAGANGQFLQYNTLPAAPAWHTLASSDVGLGNVENTKLSTWAGSANITTLGTIGTGTWNATTIGIGKGGTNATSYAANNQFLWYNGTSIVSSGYTNSSFLTTANVSGTSGYVAKFTGTNTVGNGIITDNGSGVGISSTYYNAKLNFISDATGIIIGSTRSDNSQAGYIKSNGWGSFSMNNGLAVGYDWPNSTETGMIISGNVGVGIAAPTAKLHIYGGAYPSLKLENASAHSIMDIITTGAYESGIRFYNGATREMELYAPSGDGTFRFNNANGDIMTIKGNNVGIGTITPTNGKLEVQSGGTAIYANSTDIGSYGVNATGNSDGVYGKSTTVSGGYGVYGISGSSGTGVYGSGYYGGSFSGSYSGVNATGGTYGLYTTGTSYGVFGAGGPYGVFGQGTTYGVWGYTTANNGVAVMGQAGGSNTVGVYGSGVTGVLGIGGTNDFLANGGTYGFYDTGSTYGFWTNAATWGIYDTSPSNYFGGSVGVGTSPGAARLTVGGDTYLNGYTTLKGQAYGAQVSIQSSNSNNDNTNLMAWSNGTFYIMNGATYNGSWLTTNGQGVGQQATAYFENTGKVLLGTISNSVNGTSLTWGNANFDLEPNGNLGIGVSVPTYKLQVNGQPAANGYTAFTNYSDARLKTNIRYLSDGYLGKIMQLKPSTFQYNSLTGYDQATLGRTITGFIAQDVQKVFPDMVGKNVINGTEYLDTNLSALPIYIIKAMQEQQAQIETLQTDNQNLQTQVGTLNSRLGAIENKLGLAQ